MLKYKVVSSFWAKDGSVNWATSEFGREGVGIPKSLIAKCLRTKQKLRVYVESKGAFYEASPLKISAHDKKWNTGKTAPKGATNIFIMIPVSLMEFDCFTQEKIQKMNAERAALAEKQRIKEMQSSLF